MLNHQRRNPRIVVDGRAEPTKGKILDDYSHLTRNAESFLAAWFVAPYSVTGVFVGADGEPGRQQYGRADSPGAAEPPVQPFKRSRFWEAEGGFVTDDTVEQARTRLFGSGLALPAFGAIPRHIAAERAFRPPRRVLRRDRLRCGVV